MPEGSIIPFGPVMEWSDEKPADVIDLYVYGGRDALFMLYEDEGTNYNYEKGRYATIGIRYDEAARTLSFSRRQGSFEGMLRQRRFNIVFVDGNDQKLEVRETVDYTGKALRVELRKK